MKRDQVVINQATKNSSIFSNPQLLTTTNLQTPRKGINRQGGVKEKIPELNLKNKEILHSLPKNIIIMEEIYLLKEDNHCPGTKILSMDIVFTGLTLAIKL
jgi:hypothetical protein